MKFAHMGDCHLGGWSSHPELKELNFKSFRLAIDKCIKEKVELVLITGDLFDAPYPPIETLKDTFHEFKRLKESEIPVFLIAGSHDYSVSGKTFLDVLEKAGFCKNASLYEEKNGIIFLQPVIYRNFAIYGFPGKKSGLEVDDIERLKLQDSPGLFRILMLHTAIRDALNNPQIKAVNEKMLPKVDYLALSHLHINYARENRVYSGPIFPNNLSELEELQEGSFYIFDNGKIKREAIKINPIVILNIEINNSFNATDDIINRMSNLNLKDSIFILKIKGVLEQGKLSDINFLKITSEAKKSNVFIFLKTTSQLLISESEINIDSIDAVNLENQIIEKFEESHPGKFNYLIHPLIKVLQTQKNEDEKISVFEERVLSEGKKVLQIS